MILYKYMSLRAALSVIESSSLGFSCLEDLNDPFECTAFGFEDSDETLTARVVTAACKNRFSRNYCVLSLTRQPLNSLMWTHYGDEHQGVVLGIDVHIAGLSDKNACIIPSQHGEVIYLATKPHHDPVITINDELLMRIGNGIDFETDAFNLVKRAFLYKSAEWHYEEEVRVVKDISNLPFSYYSSEKRSGPWRIILIKGRPLYCLDIPPNAIKEIYLGCHIYKNFTKKKDFSEEELRKILLHWGRKKLKLWQCETDTHSWCLRAKQSIHQQGC